jgi:hypothetical protein
MRGCAPSLEADIHLEQVVVHFAIPVGLESSNILL